MKAIDAGAGARGQAVDSADRAGAALADEMAERLLGWYDRSARDLAWRRRSDPYAIWVAEVMLQQTRAATVEPYFGRWLTRFPDVATLARADLPEVLAAWRGLGYYGRARRLHAAAVLLCRDRGGRLPGTYKDWLALPGVGPYTAGAVASIAFGERVPAIDGNARRVLARIACDDGVDAPRGARSASLARALVDRDRPGDVNQALMDLGAMVCLPRRPACDTCPLPAVCRAARERRILQLPVPAPAPRRHEARRVALVAIARHDALLLARRAEGGFLAGLWEAPQVDPGPVADRQAAMRAAGRLAVDLGLGPGRLTPRPPVGHAFTHIAWLVTPVRLDVTDRSPCDGEPFAPRLPAPSVCPEGGAVDGQPGACYDAWMWAGAARLRALPMSRLGEKVLASAGVAMGSSPADRRGP